MGAAATGDKSGAGAAAQRFEQQTFTYQPPPELRGEGGPTRAVTVVGAGPVGLSAAIDLADQGLSVVLLDDDYRLSTGSRAICFAKRTLEIFDRLGCVDKMIDKGVGWQRGKVFLRDELVYSFDLQPEDGFKHPAFINLQQYYVEGYLVERALTHPNIELRWRNQVTGLTQHADHVELEVETPDGTYLLCSEWLVACDGSRSPIRKFLGQESRGRTFKDRFLIADVRMTAPFPTERWFWFDPPFHPNQSVLLHKQPDDVWRIDFQLGWDADPEVEKRPENVIPRIQALLGKDTEFDLEWVSVYTFSCLRMEQFRYDRVLFAGDSAHGVSPFGARGANSGVQDAENLAWKLARVIEGRSPVSLLDTYDQERQWAADENILNSTRSTDFITPKSPVSRMFRDAALNLSREAPFARRLVNSGRLSTPAVLSNSVLNTPDTDSFAGEAVPGAAVIDAPVGCGGRRQWLTELMPGAFVLLLMADDERDVDDAQALLTRLREHDPRAQCLLVGASASSPETSTDGLTTIADVDGLLARRYDLQPGTAYLFRPDQHVVARVRAANPAWLDDATRRACGQQQVIQ